MFRHLYQRRVLITGASSGIGSAIAELFGSFGSTVGVHYHMNEKGAIDVADKIKQKEGRAFLFQGDLIESSYCLRLIDQFIRTAGGIDILINCAGGIIGTDHFNDLDIISWDKTLALNLTSAFILSREAFRFMESNGGGKIIMISSISAKYGGSDNSIHYGAAKAGLEAITRSFARSGAAHNILVNAVQAGVIDTPIHKKIGRTSLDERISKIPLKRAGKPDDVAMLCIYLSSDYGNYITGQIIGVTGGD